MTWRLLADGPELAVEASTLAERLRVSVDIEVSSDPREIGVSLGEGRPTGWLTAEAPSAALLFEIGRAAQRSGALIAVAIIGEAESELAVIDLASDVGVCAVNEVGPLLSVIALSTAGARRPWRASVRTLPAGDRARLQRICEGERGGGKLVRGDQGLLDWQGADATVPVGEPRDVAAAVAALRAADIIPPSPGRVIDRVASQEVLDVLFGPPRALSDPASKAALRPYGVHMPVEELCTSPSRAASEASRLGFPVRVALASPDLRIWDHPDLVASRVSTAAQVREVFRQLMTLGQSRAESARLLGVTVSAERPAQALLRAHLQVVDDRVLLELGFADPHGVASGDQTHTALPISSARLEQVVGRLAGSPLILFGRTPERRQAIEELRDLLMRGCAFLQDRPEVDRIDIEPLALLVGGGVEAREVCVTVGDAFQRSMEA
ncbi:MAG: acetate--CoA ligase family protein [Myxococcota bacterium]